MSDKPDAHPNATVGCGHGGEYAWFDPALAVEHAWGRNLPHWRQPGAIYFVTFRTADSIPADILAEWKRERTAWLARNPPPHSETVQRDYDRRFTKTMHRFLDEGHGSCPFRAHSVRHLLIDAFHARDGTDYALDTFVVMPNHVHVLISPKGSVELSAITKAWKRISAHRVNRMLGRRGTFWQEESWDHLVRTPEHLGRYQRYIQANPQSLPKP